MERLVFPPFIGKYGYVKPFTITVIEKENLSFEEIINGIEPKFYRKTEYIIEETELGEVGFYYKSFLEKLLSSSVPSHQWADYEVLRKSSREVDDLVFKIYEAWSNGMWYQL